MFKLKNCSFLLVLFLSLVLLSGCGGGGSSGGNSSSNSPEPAPYPDSTPETQDYDLVNVVTGSWIGSNGRGVAIGADGRFELRMVSLSATFNSVKFTENSGSAYVTATAVWDAYQGNSYIRTITLSYRDEYVEAQKLSSNKIRYTFPSQESKMTIEVTSETTANVIEEGNFGLGSYTYHYNGNYEVTKR